MSKKDKDEKESVKLREWVADNVTEDQEICYNAAKEAAKQIYDCFKIEFTTEETILGFYSMVYQAVMATLLKKRETNSSYVINIADRLEIGYRDSEDEDMEKVGSFVPFIYNLENQTTDFGTDDPTAKSIELCTEWETQNVKNQVKTLHEVAVTAIKLLNNIGIPNPDEVIIIPCFTMIHEAVIAYFKHYFEIYYYKEDDVDTYELYINFANNFNVSLRKDADKQTVVEIAPNVSMKVDTKNDALGGR